MPTLTPVDYNPFEQKPSGAQPSLTPVDYNPFEPKQPDSEASSIGEWTKAGGRGLINTLGMVNKAGQAVSNIAGSAVGVKPEDNIISKGLNETNRRFDKITKGYSGDQAEDVKAGRLQPSGALMKSAKWADEHKAQNLASEIVEGAVPWVVAGAVAPTTLPFLAAGEEHANTTQELIDKGMSGNEAMKKAAPGAAVAGAMFGAMHKAKTAVMGANVVKDGVMEFKDGLAKNLLKPGGSNGILSRVGREAAFVGPYLHAQGEAVSATKLASGALTKGEYQEQHGYDQNATATDNIKGVALAQGKALGTSLLTGAAFGLMAPNEHGQRDQFEISKIAAERAKEKTDAAATGAPVSLTEAKPSPDPVVTPPEENNVGQSIVFKSIDEHEAEKQKQQDIQKQQAQAQRDAQAPDELKNIKADAKLNGVQENHIEQARSLVDETADPDVKLDAAKVVAGLEADQAKEIKKQVNEQGKTQEEQAKQEEKQQAEELKRQQTADKTNLSVEHAQAALDTAKANRKKLDGRKDNTVSADKAVEKAELNLKHAQEQHEMSEQHMANLAEDRYSNELPDELLSESYGEAPAGPQEDVPHPTVMEALASVNKRVGKRGSIEYTPGDFQAAVHKIGSTAKHFFEFSKNLVAKFGETIKSHAKALWAYVKSIKPGLSTDVISPEEGKRRIDAQEAIKVISAKLLGATREQRVPMLEERKRLQAIVDGKPAEESKYDALVREKKATLEGNVYRLKNEQDSKTIASADAKTGRIMINEARAKRAFKEKAHNGVASESKNAMFDQMGVDAVDFYNAFKNYSEFESFLIKHEQYHLDGNEGRQYPKGEKGLDLMHKDAIQIGMDATLKSMSEEQKQRMLLARDERKRNDDVPWDANEDYGNYEEYDGMEEPTFDSSEEFTGGMSFGDSGESFEGSGPKKIETDAERSERQWREDNEAIAKAKEKSVEPKRSKSLEVSEGQQAADAKARMLKLKKAYPEIKNWEKPSDKLSPSEREQMIRDTLFLDDLDVNREAIRNANSEALMAGREVSDADIARHARYLRDEERNRSDYDNEGAHDHAAPKTEEDKIAENSRDTIFPVRKIGEMSYKQRAKSEKSNRSILEGIRKMLSLNKKIISIEGMDEKAHIEHDLKALSGEVDLSDVVKYIQVEEGKSFAEIAEYPEALEKLYQHFIEGEVPLTEQDHLDMRSSEDISATEKHNQKVREFNENNSKPDKPLSMKLIDFDTKQSQAKPSAFDWFKIPEAITRFTIPGVDSKGQNAADKSRPQEEQARARAQQEQAYKAYIESTKLNKLQQNLIQKFFDVMDSIGATGRYDSAHVYNAEAIAKELKKAISGNVPAKEVTRMVREFLGYTIHDKGGEKLTTDEGADIFPTEATELLRSLNRAPDQDPGAQPDIYPHDKPKSTPNTVAMINVNEVKQLFHVKLVDGTEKTITFSELEKMKRLPENAELIETIEALSKPELTPKHDVFDILAPPKGAQKFPSKMRVSGDQLDLGNIPEGSEAIYTLAFRKKSGDPIESTTVTGKFGQDVGGDFARLDELQAQHPDMQVVGIRLNRAERQSLINAKVHDQNLIDLYRSVVADKAADPAKANAELDAKITEIANLYDQARLQPERQKAIFAMIDAKEAALRELGMKARITAMRAQFDQAHIMDSAYFDKLSARLSNALPDGIDAPKPAELFSIYSNNGNDANTFNNIVARHVDEAWQVHADKTFASFVTGVEHKRNSDPSVNRDVVSKKNTDFQPEEVRAVIGTMLKASELKTFNDMMNFDTREVESVDEAGKKQSIRVPIENTLDPLTRSKLVALRDLEHRLNADLTPPPSGKEQSQRRYEKSVATREEVAQKIADLKMDSAYEGLMSDGDTMAFDTGPIPTLAHNTEILAPGMRVVSMRGKISQIFFDRLSKAFGAELVLVHGDKAFSGTYIAEGGKPQIVVNVNSGKGMVRIFSHELFHHVINKVSPEGYKAFKDALRDAVHEDKWNEAMVNMQNTMYPQYNISKAAPFETNSINRQNERINLDNVTQRNGKQKITRNPNTMAEDAYSLGKGTTSYRVGDFNVVRKEQDLSRHYGPDITPQEMLAHEAYIKSRVEEELHSEIFSQAIHQPEFWNSLAKTFEGRSVGAQLLLRIAGQSAKLMNMFKSLNNHDLNNRMVKEMVKDWTTKNEQAGVYELLHGMMAEALESNKLQHTETRNFTEATKKELEFGKTRLIDPAIKRTQEAIRKVVPKGTRSYKDVMTAIEGLAKGFQDFVSKHTPNGMFADYRAEAPVVRLMTEMLHAGQQAHEEAHNNVVLPHIEAFKGMTKDEFVKLHDDIVVNKSRDAWKALPEPQKEAFKAMRKVTDLIHGMLVERGLVGELQYNPMHFGQTIKGRMEDGTIDESIGAMLNPDRSAFNDAFTNTSTNASLASRIAKGFEPQTVNPMENFLHYVRDAHQLITLKDTIKKGLDEKYIRRFSDVREAAREGMIPVNDPAFSIIHQLMTPGERFKVKHADGTTYTVDGHEVVFDSAEEAQAAADYKVSKSSEVGPEPRGTVEKLDEASRVYSKQTFWKINRHEAVDKRIEPLTTTLREATSEAEAKELIDSQAKEEGVSYTVEPITKHIIPAITTNLYFHPDMAKLMKVILSEDKIRASKAGETIMSIKNAMTMAELSMSAFHAFTIGNEMVASYAAWAGQRYNLDGGNAIEPGHGKLMTIVKGFNPAKIKRESYDLVNVTRNAMRERALDPGNYVDSAETKAELKRLLGTDNVSALDVYSQFFGHGGALSGQDPSLVSGVKAWGGEIKYGSMKEFFGGFHETLEMQRKEHPDSKILPLSKALLHQTLQGSTAWLMEEGIPKIKFAAFAREYSLKLDKFKAEIDAGVVNRNDLARDTMKFIEDRFGEVNWKNLWLNKSYKTGLQFAFRSFTWMAGSWKALAKAGIDVGKAGWFKIKGEEYELTEKAYWGMSAIAAHVATAGLISGIYGIGKILSGEEGQDTDENTPLLTQVLFPRIDAYDNTKRITIPSYVTEAFKIMTHLGYGGGAIEPSKMVTGRFNSLLSGMVDLYKNEDFKGVLIRNPDDSAIVQAASMVKHVLPIPMSFSSMMKSVKTEGATLTNMSLGLSGLTDAPASAKRSVAANLAFDLSRREYKGKETTAEEMEMRDEFKRAMSAYSRGDKSKIDELMSEGKVSQRQYDIALTRYPVLNNMPNPKYKDQLSQALGRLTVEGALKVFDAMTDSEKEKHTKEIQQKIGNMVLRKDTPKIKQEELINRWKLLQS